jgi:hypothetical protein
MAEVKVGKHVVLVDDEDLPLVSRSRNWSPVQSGRHVYAIGYVGGKTVYMHRLITNAPKGMDVDHINHDSLDNRRANLRVCSHSENLLNRGPSCVNKNGAMGVVKVTRNKKYTYWEARITVNGKRVYLGTFKNPNDAAAAYKNGRAKLGVQ